MPELPELQAAAERIGPAIGGAQVQEAVPLLPSALKTYSPALSSLAGAHLDSVGRRGKYLTFVFGDLTLVVHLMQGGRVRLLERAPPRPRGGLLVIRFGAAGDLLFREGGTQHRASIWLLRSGDLESFEPLARLGPEADSIPLGELAASLAANRCWVHRFLRDQRAISGIGRAWTNDILHLAGISPQRMTRDLDDEQIRRLHETIASVLEDALQAERRRSEIGLPDKIVRHLRVHDRLGNPCPGCGDKIRRVSFEGYQIFYCPGCQTGGRVLADRRLSRLLK